MESESLEDRMKISHPERIQLYSAGTANGLKVAACLEEISELRKDKGDTVPFDYEPHTVQIRRNESHQDWFLAMNPAGKIPVICDPAQNIELSESGAILMYLAETYQELLPTTSLDLRWQTIRWCQWGSSSWSSEVKNLGFHYQYSTHKLEYSQEHARIHVEKMLQTLERQLEMAHGHWIVGDCYTIADISIWPWLSAMYNVYSDLIPQKFDNLSAFPKVKAWYDRCITRNASKKAFDVCPIRDFDSASKKKS